MEESVMLGRRKAAAIILALVSPSAHANEECSVVTSEARFQYSESALAARNAFLASICGGVNDDIYLSWDDRIKDRLERTSLIAPAPPLSATACATLSRLS
jgi:hypothetical protein